MRQWNAHSLAWDRNPWLNRNIPKRTGVMRRLVDVSGRLGPRTCNHVVGGFWSDADRRRNRCGHRSICVACDRLAVLGGNRTRLGPHPVGVRSDLLRRSLRCGSRGRSGLLLTTDIPSHLAPALTCGTLLQAIEGLNRLAIIRGQRARETQTQCTSQELLPKRPALGQFIPRTRCCSWVILV